MTSCYTAYWTEVPTPCHRRQYFDWNRDTLYWAFRHCLKLHTLASSMTTSNVLATSGFTQLLVSAGSLKTVLPLNTIVPRHSFPSNRMSSICDSKRPSGSDQMQVGASGSGRIKALAKNITLLIPAVFLEVARSATRCNWTYRRNTISSGRISGRRRSTRAVWSVSKLNLHTAGHLPVMRCSSTMPTWGCELNEVDAFCLARRQVM